MPDTGSWGMEMVEQHRQDTRERLAGLAMQAIITADDSIRPADVARLAIRHADALIAKLKEKKSCRKS